MPITAGTTGAINSDGVEFLGDCILQVSALNKLPMITAGARIVYLPDPVLVNVNPALQRGRHSRFSFCFNPLDLY